jgi:acyl-CoA synthetase (AMP-forming)/AMP-acid ligase II
MRIGDTMDTLVDVLLEKKGSFPEKDFLHIWNRSNQKFCYTYEDIYNGAVKYANFFKDKDLKSGDCVMILLLTRVEFFYAFFGLMMIGSIPIPVHPPIFILEWDEYKEKFLHIYNTSKPEYILCYEEVLRSIQDKILGDEKSRKRIITVEMINSSVNSRSIDIVRPSMDDVAFIQYTSGSTSLPKGAVLTHSMLIKNISAIGEKLDLKKDDIAVSWLPLYHDMGLIGNFLTVLFWGSRICLVPTEYFVMQPNVFFRIISEYKATSINSPNFGYVICNKYVNHKKMENIDLSSLKYSLIGADHIEYNDLQEFNEKFSPYGLDTNIFLPVYGLAESCLAISFSETNSSIIIDHIDWDCLNMNKTILSRKPEKRRTLKVISVGKPVKGQQIKISDGNVNDLPDDVLGEIYVKSEMLLKEYHNMAEETASAFKENGWFVTGDLGYLRKGVLFFFERKSEIIIRNGKIFRPKDFENICWRIQEIKRGRSAVIGLDSGDGNKNQDIYLLIETGTLYNEKYIEIIENLNNIYLDELGELPDYVYVLARGSIPQTSSGKLKRYKCRQNVKADAFDTYFKYDNKNKKIIYYK